MHKPVQIDTLVHWFIFSQKGIIYLWKKQTQEAAKWQQKTIK